MKIDKKSVKRILVITLTNIGDIILTTPVISVLKGNFPGARLDVMAGPLGKDIFIHDPGINKVIIYNKHIPLQRKIGLIKKLKNERYDLIVDLKNTLFPVLIGSRYASPFLSAPPKDITYKRDVHLWRLSALGIDTRDVPLSIYMSKEDEDYVERLLKDIPNKNFVAVSPASKSLIKIWDERGFAEVCDRLINDLNVSVIMAGDKSDRIFINGITSAMKEKAYNLAGMTTIPQLVGLFRKSSLVITNDSAPMHAAAAAGAKILAIFGPTDPEKYGPRGEGVRIIRRDLPCSPCEVAQCRYNHECMKLILADEVYNAAREILAR